MDKQRARPGRADAGAVIGRAAARAARLMETRSTCARSSAGVQRFVLCALLAQRHHPRRLRAVRAGDGRRR